MSKDEIQHFKKVYPYNFSNVLVVDDKNDYKRLGELFRSWIDKKILTEDKKPCFYLHEQRFEFENKLYRRLGFLGLLRIDKPGIVFPHEHTFGAPKKDRYSILKELKANLSPIFIIVPGRLNILDLLYQAYRDKSPFMRFKDFSNIENRVWRIENKSFIRKIYLGFFLKDLFIADGHHRFEVAYKYFKKMKNKFKDLNYILTYFTDSKSGILILPTHRVIKIKTDTKDVFKKLSKYFDIERLTKKGFKNSFHNSDKLAFGLYVKRNYYLLHLKNDAILDKILKRDKEKIYRDLDVYILHKFIFPSLKKERDIIYTHSLEEATKLAGRDKLAFILKPASLNNVFRIAKCGYRLPHKSTYFYPKLPSGVVIRRFET